MNATQLERDRRYRATPRGKYTRHKVNARKRGIPFELTFQQWWSIWHESGFFHKIGSRRGRYCMQRLGDRGAYCVGNVKIGPWLQNLADARRVSAVRRHTTRTDSVSYPPAAWDDVPF